MSIKKERKPNPKLSDGQKFALIRRSIRQVQKLLRTPPTYSTKVIKPETKKVKCS